MKRKRNANKNKGPVILEDSDVNVPQSFVIHHGEAGTNIKNLVSDFKNVMKPNTAQRLIAKKRNTLSDFVKMSGPMKVSHLIMFSQTKSKLYLKLSRLPQGPTLTFSIKNYSLLKDVLSTKATQLIDAKRFLVSPCLMTNLQPSEGTPHLQICSKMFLDMFPTINPSNVKTKDITRCCLFHYNEEEETFDFRHYAIKLSPLGITKSTSKLIGSKVPNLGSYQELSDFIVKSEGGSESEAEESNVMSVNMVKKDKGRIGNEQSVVKLSEIGPRLTLELIKVENGLCSGAVLYHKYIQKSDKELLEQQKKREATKLLKRKRRMEQEKNIQLKKKEKEKHRRRCLLGMNIDAEQDDDSAYYKEEVGEEPQKDLFQERKRKDKSEYSKYSKKFRK